MAELVDALGSGSSVLWTWEFESPLRHQPKPKFSRLYLEKSPQRLSRKKGQIAQLVEQRTENPCVGGSIPPLATNNRNTCLIFSISYKPISPTFFRSFKQYFRIILENKRGHYPFI